MITVMEQARGERGIEVITQHTALAQGQHDTAQYVYGMDLAVLPAHDSGHAARTGSLAPVCSWAEKGGGDIVTSLMPFEE